MIHFDIRMTREHLQALERVGQSLPKVARQLTLKVGFDAVAEVMEVNRVDTGRSRMGWTALLRRHGVPVDENGGTPGSTRRRGVVRTAQELAQARAEGIAASRATERELPGGGYLVSVENPVEYVPDLDRRYPFVKAAFRRATEAWRDEVQEAMAALVRGSR